MTTDTLTYRCPHCRTPVELKPGSDAEMQTCPNPHCNKPFRVEVPEAIPVPPLVLPSGETSNGTVASSAHPEAEREIQTVHLRMMRRYPFRCLGYGLLVAAGLAGIIGGWVKGWPLLVIVAVIAAAVGGYRLLTWWLRMQNTALKITNRRCIVESGVFSKQAREVSLSEINEIQVSQTTMQRMMDVGDLTLATSSNETRYFIIMAVPDPKTVACLIRDTQEDR